MKLYKKKDRLFFHRPALLESLSIRLDQSSRIPSIIILNNQDWKEYIGIFHINPNNHGEYSVDIKSKIIYSPRSLPNGRNTIPCVLYKGIAVINYEK